MSKIAKKVVLERTQLEALRELNEPGGGDIVTELIEIYLEQSPATLSRLQAEIGMRNGFLVERLAHKLKGSSANLGAEFLRSLCQQAEERAREGSFPELERLFGEIDQAYQEARALLEKDWRRPAA